MLGILEVWGFQLKTITQNQPHISFLTVWQHWLGMAKPKNVFRSQVVMNNKKGYGLDFFTIRHCFVLRHATAAATYQASWIPVLCPPLSFSSLC